MSGRKSSALYVHITIYENFIILVKMIAVLLKLDDKYKPAKKTVQKQLSVTSMSAATGL